ncbi:hypothetical protein [Aeromicrobium sp. 179-A 4D2 NHS]|uniref:hypothetical protein n=1 Tax=Aeromicrobium sp. 179-A 4D2 NHS TaxID=3142375 RepID=UPI0039A2B8FE
MSALLLQDDLDLFLLRFGHMPKIDLRVTDLTRWHIHQCDPYAFTSGPVSEFHGETTLWPETPLFVRQRHLWPSQVERYAAMMSLGDTIAAVQVTDVEPGGLWHINGLHRMVAARLLGRTLTAEIWR